MRFKITLGSTAAAISAAILILIVFVLIPLAAMMLVLDDLSFDLGGALSNDDWVALNILAVHLLGCSKELVGVAEGDKSEPFRFACYLVADNTRLLQRFPPRECLEQAFVGCLAREITNKEAQVRRVPLQK
ncbi:hypothetical protein NUW58_g7689 [Xylaria curta]|uniref:Uncharacterized protein n=1 Tax=Xylaria curta TaxID=42375 RepID=A0ACC1NFL5_9PEZI|nr:hypothetical protein NUW58_g7689 [Xylaria curta]